MEDSLVIKEVDFVFVCFLFVFFSFAVFDGVDEHRIRVFHQLF